MWSISGYIGEQARFNKHVEKQLLALQNRDNGTKRNGIKPEFVFVCFWLDLNLQLVLRLLQEGSRFKLEPTKNNVAHDCL